jgi:hypothetical protein
MCLCLSMETATSWVAPLLAASRVTNVSQFNDELIREKEEGGMRAARMMNDAVEKYIHQSVPEAQASRVVVRVYADLTNLSKQLAKSKVTGLEKRSIAPFSAGFTRAMSLFDFVDSLDGEGAKFKIRGRECLLRLQPMLTCV